MAKPLGHYDSTNVFTLLVKLITESDSNSEKCSVFNNQHINYICDEQCLMVSWFGELERLDVPFCFFSNFLYCAPTPRLPLRSNQCWSYCVRAKADICACKILQNCQMKVNKCSPRMCVCVWLNENRNDITGNSLLHQMDHLQKTGTWPLSLLCW